MRSGRAQLDGHPRVTLIDGLLDTFGIEPLLVSFLNSSMVCGELGIKAAADGRNMRFGNIPRILCIRRATCRKDGDDY